MAIVLTDPKLSEETLRELDNRDDYDGEFKRLCNREYRNENDPLPFAGVEYTVYPTRATTEPGVKDNW